MYRQRIDTDELAAPVAPKAFEPSGMIFLIFQFLLMMLTNATNAQVLLLMPRSIPLPQRLPMLGLHLADLVALAMAVSPALLYLRQVLDH